MTALKGWMRIPGHADHQFRFMSITDSVSCRSLIPALPITIGDTGFKEEKGANAG
jgi:hypothetical protein